MSIYTRQSRVQTRAEPKLITCQSKPIRLVPRIRCNYNYSGFLLPHPSMPFNPSFLLASQNKIIVKRQIIHGRFVSLAPLGRPVAASDWPGNLRRLHGLAPEPWSWDARANQSGWGLPYCVSNTHYYYHPPSIIDSPPPSSQLIGICRNVQGV